MTLNPILSKAGIDTHLIYSSNLDEIYKEIGKISPDIVSYSLMFGTHKQYLQLFDGVKRKFPHIKQICGGPFTTFYPEIIETTSLDAISLGESDTTIVTLSEALMSDTIKECEGFWVKDVHNKIIKGNLPHLLEDLDSLPFPDREILYQKDPYLKTQEFKSFMSGRGCPYPCTYCFNHKFNEMYKGKGKIIRRKSADYFVEEVLETKKKYGCQFAIF
ncbi:MAG: cobalamin-dependent protein [Nitrospinae bacterium]|nr:cobalamin-dependent protein [Nitrospinota bacterium]